MPGRRQVKEKIENLEETCPFCGCSVIFQFGSGVISSPEYVLVADWIYHRECWDRQASEVPCGGQQSLVFDGAVS